MGKLLIGEFQNGAQVTESNEAMHFQIQHLLIGTTVVAILIAIGQRLSPSSSLQGASVEGEPLRLMLVAIFVVTTTTLLGIWAVLGRSSLLRSATVFVMLGGLIPAVSWFVIVRLPVVWCTILGLTAMGVFMYLALLRTDGYRFVKHGT